MLSALSSCDARVRSGVGDFSLTDLYASIANDAGSGASTLGEISGALLNLGLTVEAARMALTTVRNNVGANPQQLAAINAELNYLNTYGGTPQRNQWLVPGLILGAIALWYLASDRK